MIATVPTRRSGALGWHHVQGAQDGDITCPLGRCDAHTTARFSHYLDRVEPTGAGRTLAAILLNPSCPDERNSMFGRVRNLADEPGTPFDRVVFLNVFAYRGRHLDQITDADVRSVAARNREVVLAELSHAHEIVVAWGQGVPKPLRAAWDDEIPWFEEVLGHLPVPVVGIDGAARHPRAWRKVDGGYRPALAPYRSR